MHSKPRLRKEIVKGEKLVVKPPCLVCRRNDTEMQAFVQNGTVNPRAL